MSVNQNPRILFLVTEDWFFRTHRLALARACLRAGSEVFVMTLLNKPATDLLEEGFQVVPWQVSRGSINPLREASALRQVIREYRRIRPDIVHHVALKPVIYGGLAARFLNIPAVNAITGLGVVFTSESKRLKVLSFLLMFLLTLSMRRKNARAIFQTNEDLEALIRRGIVTRSTSYLIRGSGVDTSQFIPKPEPTGIPLVVLATRMIWSKGVGVFVDAAKQLRDRGVNARFALVGDPDQQNPAGVRQDQLQEWHSSGVVEWWPHRGDMPSVFAQSTVVCFPSYYGEGVPKVLLEAAASGRPTVTTDSPGCRDAVRNDENGLLVPCRDAGALANALQMLLSNRELRLRMGRRAREIAVQEFSIDQVISETMSVYTSLLPVLWNTLKKDTSYQREPVRAN